MIKISFLVEHKRKGEREEGGDDKKKRKERRKERRKRMYIKRTYIHIYMYSKIQRP